MPNRILYAIADWDTVYETASTRKLKHLHWVPVPNKQDGRAYCCIMAEADGLAILGAWLVLLEVASKMPIRGVLADSRGPLSVRDIAVKSRASMAGIQRALDVLSSPEIGWITAQSQNFDMADFPPVLADPTPNPPFTKIPPSVTKPSQSAQIGRLADLGSTLADFGLPLGDSPKIEPGIEQNRTEQNRREENRNCERASGRSTALGERPPARPPRDGSGPTGNAGATPASEPGERLQPQRALVDLTWQAMQGRFPDVDRSMAERVAAVALQEAEANGLSPADLERRIGDYVRQATRPKQRSAGMYLTTVPEEIRTRGKEAGKVAVITCDRCGDRGYVPRAEGRFWPDSSAIAGAIDRGEARLCECEAGEGWRALFANLAAPMRDKNGREVRTGFRAPGSVAV